MIDSLLGPRGRWVDLFEARVWSSGPQLKLPYRFLEPGKPAAGERLPLVLFLHGAGERGDNNRSQLRHGVHRFALPEERAAHPAYVLAPQCPAGNRSRCTWMSSGQPDAGNRQADDRDRGGLLGILIDLMARTAQEYPVDPQRVYVTGISMGGFGTWALMAARPDLFAAAVPVCGGGDPAWAPRIKGIPVWAFHGSDDTVVPVEYTRRMIEALRLAGAEPRYTEYPGVGHDSWTPAYREPELLDWMFAQSKRRGD